MNFAKLLTTTHTVIKTGGDDTSAAKAGFAALKGSKITLASLLKQDREHTELERSVSAAYRALVASMRAVVIGCGVDATSYKVVCKAIAQSVWEDEGHKTPLVNSKTDGEPDLTAADIKVYNNVKKRIERLARGIVGETAPLSQVVKPATVIPRALRASLKASTVDAGVDYKVALAALKAVYGK